MINNQLTTFDKKFKSVKNSAKYFKVIINRIKVRYIMKIIHKIDFSIF